jgi:site-specific recombinase XerD
LSATTIDAYSRAVEGFLAYCRERRVDPRAATSEHVVEYLRELGGRGLRDAAQRQRLTAIRLFYAFVVEQGGRADNPAGGTTTSLLSGADDGHEGTLWVPDEGAWGGVLSVVSAESGRTRVMLALAYAAALRREELCGLRVGDVDTERWTVRVSLPGQPGRVVPIGAEVAAGCAWYLRWRIDAEPGGGALFLSESPRNRHEPLSGWTWSKVVREIARKAGVAHFTTQTPRHLRLTDLARVGWKADAIARFAGHSGPSVARRYVRQAELQPEPDPTELERRRAEQLAVMLLRESA